MTIVSGLVLWCYSYPKFVYKKLFDCSYFAYARETLGHIAVFVASAAISYLIINQIHLGSTIVRLVMDVNMVVIVLAFHRAGSLRVVRRVLILPRQ